MNEDAKAVVQRLRDAERTLEDQLIAARTALVEARQRGAQAVLTATLDGGSDPTTGESATAIAERIAAIEAAIIQVRAQRVDAIRAVWAAEAATVRDQAAALTTEADDHERGTRELLAALDEREGCTFGVVVGTSKSFTLRDQVRTLVNRADTITRRTVAQAGRVEAESRDELLTALRGWDAMKIAPTIHAATEWYDSVSPHGTATIAIVWSNGQIDRHESRVILPPREEPGIVVPGVVVTNGRALPNQRWGGLPSAAPVVRWHDSLSA